MEGLRVLDHTEAVRRLQESRGRGRYESLRNLVSGQASNTNRSAPQLRASESRIDLYPSASVWDAKVMGTQMPLSKKVQGLFSEADIHDWNNPGMPGTCRAHHIQPLVRRESADRSMTCHKGGRARTLRLGNFFEDNISNRRVPGSLLLSLSRPDPSGASTTSRSRQTVLSLSQGSLYEVAISSVRKTRCHE